MHFSPSHLWGCQPSGHIGKYNNLKSTEYTELTHIGVSVKTPINSLYPLRKFNISYIVAVPAHCPNIGFELPLATGQPR